MSFGWSKHFGTTLAVFPLQLGLHNFNLKSCSLMLNSKAADFLLRRKKESGNKGERKKTSKDSTFLEGVLEEKNTSRKEDKLIGRLSCI